MGAIDNHANKILIVMWEKQGSLTADTGKN